MYLLHRFSTGKFSGKRRPTIGSDFMSRRIEIHDVDVFLQIWDTAGQERFQSGTLGNTFYRGAHGALLVYDVNNEKSIEQVALWRDECLSHQDSDAFFPIVVIGNKVDLREDTPKEERVDQSEIVSWCRDQSYGHIETSAKDGLGVEAAMLAITALALESQRNNQHEKKSSQEGNIDLNKMYTPKRRGLCDGCSS